MAFDKLLLTFRLTNLWYSFLFIVRFSKLCSHTHHEQMIQIVATERHEFKQLQLGEVVLKLYIYSKIYFQI